MGIIEHLLNLWEHWKPITTPTNHLCSPFPQSSLMLSPHYFWNCSHTITDLYSLEVVWLFAAGTYSMETAHAFQLFIGPLLAISASLFSSFIKYCSCQHATCFLSWPSHCLPPLCPNLFQMQWQQWPWGRNKSSCSYKRHLHGNTWSSQRFSSHSPCTWGSSLT